MSLRMMSRPRACLRLSVTERLLALSIRKEYPTPPGDDSARRRLSPTPGGSILMISAPICASCKVQYGAAKICPRSITRIPSSGRPIELSSSSPPRRRRHRARSAQQVARDHHPMHFRGAFADPADARLAVPSLERKLLAHAIAAVDLHRAVDHAPQRLARIQFRDRRFHPRVLAAVGLPRAVPGKPSGRAQLDLGVREHPLDRLAARQQLAEGLALLGMSDRHPKRRHADADIAR